MRAVAAEDLTAAVPSCPGWTLAELVTHVAAVYLHKVEAMRQRRQPDPWPPDFSGEQPLALFDRAYAALLAEFDARQPGDPAYTFDDRDQSVGFWLRRMAHETSIHRVDAELARGVRVTPIPEDLALDGIDELLTLFVDYASHRWPEEFAEALPDGDGQPVAVRSGPAGWQVTPSATAVNVTVGAGQRPAAATLSGGADAVQRWLWGRAPDSAVELDGDPQALARFRRLLTIATQ